MPPTQDPAVKSRLILFVSGFDPAGVRRYHRWQLDDARRATAGSAPYQLVVGPRKRLTPLLSTWTIQFVDGEQTATNTFCFLHWDDIVRRRWPRDVRSYLKAALSGGCRLLCTGRWWRLWRLHRVSASVLLLPYLCMALWLLSAFVIASKLLIAVVGATACLTALLCAMAVWWPWHRYRAGWILRSIHALMSELEDDGEALRDRLQSHADQIRCQFSLSSFEALTIVGHSSGAMHAVRLANLMTEQWSASSPYPIELLTLGHSIPVQTVSTKASGFRESLVRAALDPRVAWLDVSSAIDGCCFPGVSPLWNTSTSNSSPPSQSPVVIHAKFHLAYDEETYAKLRKEKFSVHFLYLRKPWTEAGFDIYRWAFSFERLADRISQYGPVPS